MKRRLVPSRRKSLGGSCLCNEALRLRTRLAAFHALAGWRESRVVTALVAGNRPRYLANIPSAALVLIYAPADFARGRAVLDSQALRRPSRCLRTEDLASSKLE